MHLKLITVLEDQHVTRYQISVLKIQSEDLEKYCNENFIHDHLRVRKIRVWLNWKLMPTKYENLVKNALMKIDT